MPPPPLDCLGCINESQFWNLQLQYLQAIYNNGSGGGGGGGPSNLTGINGVVPSVGCGTSDSGTLRVAHATNCTIPVTVTNGAGASAVNIQDGGNSITVDGTVSITANSSVNVAQVAGTATSVNNGTADAGTIRVTVASNSTGNIATIGTSVTPGTAAANLGKAEDSVAASGDVGVFALMVANEAQSTLAADGDYIAHATDTKGNSLIVGNIANDGVDAGFPVKIGTVARTTLPTAVSDGDRVNTMGNKYGELTTVHAIREMRANQVTTITASTSETTIVTAVASFNLDLYGLIVTNTSATSVNVAIKDSTGGTTRLNIAVPAGETRGYMLPASDGIKQATANNNWTATVSASVTSVIITALTKQTT